jgi:hypothetical protein
MKKRWMFVLILVVFAVNLSAQNTIIALINIPNEKQIRATVQTNKTMFVGLTINPDTQNEINFRVQKVSEGISYVDFDVSDVHKPVKELKRVFNDPANWAKNNIIEDGLPYVVALWEKKVNAIQCTIDNSKPCQYCKKRGYHLEGRVDRATARYSPDGRYEIIDKQ